MQYHYLDTQVQFVLLTKLTFILKWSSLDNSICQYILLLQRTFKLCKIISSPYEPKLAIEKV